MENDQKTIRSFLDLPDPGPPPVVTVHDQLHFDGFTRKKVSFDSDGDAVEAFLFEPDETRSIAVVALHQHNSQWHLGKSEIAGIAGDPFQAFGPALARAGVSVLAPDAVGFESRRGAVADPVTLRLAPHLNADRGSNQTDWLQYYNHAMHRLARGELLMRKLLIDAVNATTALTTISGISKVGVVGHSYGGNVALFAGALDTRLAFTVSSGALSSYRYKFANGIGLEMALVIPGFAARFDFDDLLRCIAPRSVLVVSSDADPMAADAEELVERAQPTFARLSVESRLCHFRGPGAHALDQLRHDFIVDWILNQASVADERSPTPC